MRGTIRVFREDFLDELVRGAAASGRRRKNANIHADGLAPCNRLFNALMGDTYIRPHCHREETKDETVVVLRGRMGLVEFDEAGEVLGRWVVGCGEAVDIPHGVMHGWCVLEDGTIFFETKAGPYVPVAADEWAAFAPAEGEGGAASYRDWMKGLFAGE